MIVTAKTAREAVELARHRNSGLRRASLLISRISDTEWKVTAR